MPIGRFNVRSFITSVADGAQGEAGQQVRLKGIAFDGGTGIKEVPFSDDGKSWARPSSARISASTRSANGQLPVYSGGRPARAQGARHQQRRPDAADDAAVESRGYLRNVVENHARQRQPEEDDHETPESSSRWPASQGVTVALRSPSTPSP